GQIQRHLLLFVRMRRIWNRIGEWLIIPKGGAIESIDIGARLLEFQLIEEGVRNIDPLVANADGINPALCNLTGPEVGAPLVGEACQEIVVMQLHEETRDLDGIGSRWTDIVVNDGNGNDGRRTQYGATGRITESQVENLGAFDIEVVNNQHRKVL